MCVQLLSRVQLFVTPWTVTHQAPLFMGFSRQEKWNGLPFFSPGDLSDPAFKPDSPTLAGRFFTTSVTWEAPVSIKKQKQKTFPSDSNMQSRFRTIDLETK